MAKTLDDYPYLDTIRNDVLSLVPESGAVIGSVGCGQAKTEEVLVRAGREVHGVDVSAHAVEIARDRLTSARVVDGDDSQPFAEDSLDGLILTDVLEHLPLARSRLASYAKMVKKGGWVVISVPNMRQLGVLSTIVFKGDWPEYPMGIFDETHIQVMTHKRLGRWAAEAGLAFQKYQDSYDSRFWQRNIYRAMDKLTLGCFRSLFQFEVVALFVRK
jgi:O-antigen biosynthesis protein